jgi:pimeloyl-ACP methyl ester carboxylesterase
MFRDLIPRLAGKYHVIAPDHLGFGYSAMPYLTNFALYPKGMSIVECGHRRCR